MDGHQELPFCSWDLLRAEEDHHHNRGLAFQEGFEVQAHLVHRAEYIHIGFVWA